jgi:hypothetical protein
VKALSEELDEIRLTELTASDEQRALAALGLDDYLLAKLGRNCSWAPTSGSWRLRWR